MNLYDEFFSIIGLFNQLGVRYAVVGGLAVAFHGKPRFTRDIDILVAPEDITLVREACERLSFHERAKPWTFRNSNLTLHRFLKIAGGDDLMVDVLLANADEHKQVIANAIPTEFQAGTARIASKKDIIWMKKSRNSDQDKADIQELENDKA
ncbi:MAG: hypothetical protein NTX50_04040 [Candidatus Sumerlaeota bacterium]|nr:hypothetical protein [Candidatus Sumerlaeota bacterium]